MAQVQFISFHELNSHVKELRLQTQTNLYDRHGTQLRQNGVDPRLDL